MRDHYFVQIYLITTIKSCTDLNGHFSDAVTFVTTALIVVDIV